MQANTKPDWITVVIVVLLLSTLAAFFAGVFSYPYGVIVLAALLLFRLSTSRQKEPE